MALRLGTVFEDRPVKLGVEIPAALYRELVRYAAAHAAEQQLDQPLPPERLVGPMIEAFMESDRGFARHRPEK
jgi:hypothetical protein